MLSEGNVRHLVELLEYQASRAPDKTAEIFLGDGETEEAKLTYSELATKARAIGALLAEHRAAGERVVLCFPPGLDFTAAFFGCLYAGAVAVPTYPPNPSQLKRSMPRFRGIVKDCKPKLVLTSAGLKLILRTLFLASPGLWGLKLLSTEAAGAELASSWKAPKISPDSLAFLQYTSGSTSEPKGVMVTHANILHNTGQIRDFAALDEAATWVSWLPLFHDMGLVGGVLTPVRYGGTAVLMSPLSFIQKPVRWLAAISKYRARVSAFPHFAIPFCSRKLTAEEKRGLDLSSWTVAFNGAEPIRSEDLERFAENFAACGFKKTSMHPVYGLAEATVCASGPRDWNEPRTAPFEGGTLVGCGRTVGDQRIAIADPETRGELPESKVGEIWLKGPGIAGGYWMNEEKTEAAFRARLEPSGDGPYLRTGDLGFLRDGELFVTGRIKDLIIVRGRNYYPQDLEHTVEQLDPAIRPGCLAAFSVVEDGVERVVIVAEVERRHRGERRTPERVATTDDRRKEEDPDPQAASKPGGELDPKALIESIRAAIHEEHELQLHAISLIQARTISKTSSGKIQRHACRQAFVDRKLDLVAEWRAE